MRVCVCVETWENTAAIISLSINGATPSPAGAAAAGGDIPTQAIGLSICIVTHARQAAESAAPSPAPAAAWSSAMVHAGAVRGFEPCAHVSLG